MALPNFVTVLVVRLRMITDGLAALYQIPAAILTADRNAAMRRRARTSTFLDANARTIRSGASAHVLQLPRDVAFDALLAKQCGGRATGATIDFFPAGTSCGGTIALAHLGAGFQVRVNWLTGGVEVVSVDQPAQ